MEADKKLHAAFGVLTAVVVMLLILISGQLGTPAAMAIGATLMGVGYELQQKLRGEGEPDLKDALVTSVAGSAAAIAAHFLGA
jgi:hypothetical protein